MPLENYKELSNVAICKCLEVLLACVGSPATGHIEVQAHGPKSS